MLKNYLTTALRSLWRQKGYSFINIAGLTLGLACCALMYLFVLQELSFDRHHEKASRIYRIAQVLEGADYMGTNRFAATPLPLAEAILQEFPEVEATTAMGRSQCIVKRGEDLFSETTVYVDKRFFDVFTVPFVRGSASLALTLPGSVVITRSTAAKYFGREDPIGHYLNVDKRELKVTGVVEDAPPTSHFSYQLILSIADAINPHGTAGWDFPAYWTYIALKPEQDPNRFQEKLVTIDRKYLAGMAKEPIDQSRFFMQPLTDIHLGSDINYEIGPNGDRRMVHLITTLAIIILLIAGINYVNLATARSARRAREIGVRKAIGAQRTQLVGYILAESILTCFIALLPALILAESGRHLFEYVSGVHLSLKPLSTPSVFLAMFGVTLVLGLLSGGYPALVLSALTPVPALTGRRYIGGGRTMLRSVLVVGQFAATIVLGIAVLVVHEQMQFVRKKDLGYHREQVVAVPAWGKAGLMKEQLRTVSGVLGVGGGSHMPFDVIRARPLTIEGNEIMIYDLSVDEDYLNLLGMKLVAGRGFTSEHHDYNTYLINESAARALNWEAPIGKPLFDGTVIGVVKDFHLHSLQRAIEPMYFRYTDQPWLVMARIRTNDISATIAAIRKTARKIVPDQPVEPSFLDDAYARFYTAETTFGRILGSFTLIALWIACLGLTGLAAFTTDQRTKEIGIRKIFGATAPRLVGLLTRDVVLLVVSAFLCAAPLAYFVMQRWLGDFAYRVTISPDLFILAGVLAILIALLTVSYQVLRTALTNPAESLRYE